MTSRNEQFVCFTAVLAVALPALMWFRYVGPLRSGIAADELALNQMRVTLGQYVEAELEPASESDRSQALKISQTRFGVERLMNTEATVSEMYQGIELAASKTRLSVSRIEPSRSIESKEFQGPLQEASISAEYRTYRIEIAGPAADLPVFIDRLADTIECAVVREIRAAYSTDDDGDREVAASVTLDSIEMKPLAVKDGGGK